MAVKKNGGGGTSTFETKTDAAVTALRQAIAEGRYAPGEKLRQARIADELGLSPTPVREALRRLQAEGLVTHSPHRGVRVTDLAPGEMDEIYRVLAVLEGLVIRMVAERLSNGDVVHELERVHANVLARVNSRNPQNWASLNTQFHEVLKAACGAPRLTALLEALWGSVPRDPIGVVEGMAESTISEHAEILEALRAGSPDVTEDLMRRHVEHLGRDRLQFLEARGNSQPPGKGRRPQVPGANFRQAAQRQAPPNIG